VAAAPKNPARPNSSRNEDIVAIISLEEFAHKLRDCRKVVFFTGAGISTESGVPDFRSPGGVWTKYQPVYFQDFVASEVARIQHWQLKKATYELYKTVKPNIGHYAIRDFEVRGQLLGLITQNIDGLHKLAGVSDEKLVELHGTDRLVTCLSCDKRYEPASVYELLGDEFKAPTCDVCGGFLKSANVSFGQSMPVEAMRRAQAWSEKAEIFIVIGSSLQVQPAASFPVIAKRSGALLAIVNRDETPLDELADFIHRGASGRFFEQLILLLTDA
jgi:NAD-dependent deacetylase